MARGYIYYVTKNKDQDVSFTKEQYYESLDRLGIDYVDDMANEDSADILKMLAEMLYKQGAVVGYGHSNRDFMFSFVFSDADSMKRNYFEPKLAKLKAEAAALTLENVIRSAPCLDCITNSNYSDLVAFDDGNATTDMTFDNFIRNLESGVTYYVYRKVILAH